MIAGIVGVAVVVIIALTMLGGNGDDDEPPAVNLSGGPSLSGGGAVVTGELNSDIGVTTLPEPIVVEFPEGTSLLGSNNQKAAEAVRAFFAESGIDLTGVDIFVFPVADAGESLLVLDADVGTLTALDEATSGNNAVASEDPLAGLMQLPEMQAANVTRLVMNLRDSDDQGPFVTTITLPLGFLDPNNSAYADLTEEEALEIFKVQVSR